MSAAPALVRVQGDTPHHPRSLAGMRGALHDGTGMWRALGCPVVALERGSFEDGLPPGATREFRFAVLLGGFLLQNTRLRDRAVSEVLGEGDLIDLRTSAESCALGTTTDHTVHCRARVALVPERVEGADRVWPGVQRLLQEQLVEQCRRASTHLAVLNLPRVEDRIAAVFVELAQRAGRVTTDGVVIDLPLTHSVIGRMVAARRPTVSLALTALAEAGVLARRADGTWLLSRAAGLGAGEPPPLVA